MAKNTQDTQENTLPDEQIDVIVEERLATTQPPSSEKLLTAKKSQKISDYLAYLDSRGMRLEWGIGGDGAESIVGIIDVDVQNIPRNITQKIHGLTIG